LRRYWYRSACWLFRGRCAAPACKEHSRSI